MTANGADPPRRCSSARQSKRLIIAVSPVQIRPPLQAGSRPAEGDVWSLHMSIRSGSFLSDLQEEAQHRGRHRCPSEDHNGVSGVQAPQLHHTQEPPQRPRSSRAAQVLPELQAAHRPPRDSLTRAAPRRPSPVRGAASLCRRGRSARSYGSMAL